MTESFFGSVGARAACATFLFISYALLVAYVAEGGAIINQLMGLDSTPVVGSVVFTLLIGGLIVLGQESFVEKVNGTIHP